MSSMEVSVICGGCCCFPFAFGEVVVDPSALLGVMKVHDSMRMKQHAVKEFKLLLLINVVVVILSNLLNADLPPIFIDS